MVLFKTLLKGPSTYCPGLYVKTLYYNIIALKWHMIIFSCFPFLSYLLFYCLFNKFSCFFFCSSVHFVSDDPVHLASSVDLKIESIFVSFHLANNIQKTTWWKGFTWLWRFKIKDQNYIPWIDLKVWANCKINQQYNTFDHASSILTMRLWYKLSQATWTIDVIDLLVI